MITYHFISSEGRPFIGSLLTTCKSFYFILFIYYFFKFFYFRVPLIEGVKYLRKRTQLSCIFMHCYKALTLPNLYSCNLIIMSGSSKVIILGRIISTIFSVLLIFFPSKIYQVSSQMANSPQGQSPFHSDLCHSSVEKPFSRALRTSVKCLS